MKLFYAIQQRQHSVDRITQINNNIIALQHMAELHRKTTKNTKLSSNTTLTEEFFAGINLR